MGGNAKDAKQPSVLMKEADAYALIHAYGIQVPQNYLATDEEEAVEASDKIGYPVALKVVSGDILHKTDVGGVALDVASPDEVRSAFRMILDKVGTALPEAHIAGISVNEMFEPGFECILGAMKDQSFGHVVMFGLGGIFAEVMQDVSFRLLPLERHEALSMINEVKGAQLLGGARGRPKLAVECIADALMALSRLLSDYPDINEIDINPCLLYEDQLIAVDVKIMCSDS